MAYFGALKAGMVVLPANPLLKAAEIEHQLTDSAASSWSGWPGCMPRRPRLASLTGLPLYLVAAPAALPDGALPFTELMSTAPLAEPGGPIWPGNADDTAVLIYTSGTTGKPKGAELTHFLLYMNCTISGQLFGARPDDVTLAVLPFFHVFGLSSVINVTVRYGGCLSIVPRFEPGDVLDAIEQDKCSVISGVPTMLHALAQVDVTGRDLSALRVAVSGGSSLPEDVMRTFEAKYGLEVLEGYGLSETGSTSSFNRPGDRKPLSVGKPIWGVQMRVADTGDQALPPGQDQIGEIQIRGHNVMKGYRNRPEATASALAGGWLHTGDLGYAGTKTASTSSSTAPRTWSSAADTTSTRARSRKCCTPIRASSRPPLLASRTTGSARKSSPWWCCTRAPNSASRRSSTTAGSGSRRTSTRARSGSVPELPKGPSGKILKTELRDA